MAKRRNAPIEIGHAVAMVLILASAISGGCGARQSAPKAVDDAGITSAVRAKLSAVFGPLEGRQERQIERGADKQSISFILVKSVRGVVTLTGEVRSNRAKAQAEDLARSVQQVSAVKNNLSVAPGYSDDAVGGK